MDQVNRIIQENLTAIRVVKSYVRGDYETAKFEQVNTELRTASEQAFRLAALNMPAMQFVMYGTILSILWFGGNILTIGGIGVGELTGFKLRASGFKFPDDVFQCVLMITRAMASWHRIMEVMHEDIDIKEDRATDIRVERGEIEFNHVSFKYNREALRDVLSDISLHIKGPGQTVGIIGQTGAAKSTLVQLIPRLYEATKERCW